MFGMWGPMRMTRWMRVEYLAGAIGQNSRLTPKQVVARAEAIVAELEKEEDKERQHKKNACAAYDKAKEKDKEYQNITAERNKKKEVREEARKQLCVAQKDNETKAQAELRLTQTRKLYDEFDKSVDDLKNKLDELDKRIAARIAKKFKVDVEDVR